MTDVAAALAGVTRLAFDTSPIIYLIERHTHYWATVFDIFRRIDSGEISGVTSMITLGEVLGAPYLRNDDSLAREYRDLLLNSEHFQTVVIDHDLAERAARLRARHRLRLPDALQIAAAFQADASAFLTNDRALQRVIEIRVLVMDDLVS